MKDKIPLSVVIITKNEEANIKDCLESVKWADDIVLVDDNSSDRTIEIAKAYTERIFCRKMDIEGRHRNWAHNQARNSWILSLDADERVTPELKEEIIDLLNNPLEFRAFSIPRRNYIGGYWVKYGGLYPSAQIKMFRKEYFCWEEAEVHPRPILNGSSGQLKGDIIHYSYKNFAHFLNKVNAQTSLEAAKWFRDKRKMGKFKAFWRAYDRFMRTYFRKKGHKDGFVGFMAAFFAGLYQLLSYAKYWELKNNAQDTSSRRMLICPVCGNDKWLEAYRIKQWSIGECTVCGFARIDPLPTIESRPGLYSQEVVVNRNTKKLNSTQKLSRVMKRFFNKLTSRDKNGIFLRKLFLYKSPGAKILDIGCGDGSFIKQVKGRFDCRGLEISEYLAGKARESGLNIILGNFLLAEFADEKFDAITLISLLEHLDDPAAAMAKCFSLLNIGGVLLIKTVNYGCFNRIIKRGNWTGFRPPDHIVYFTPASLKRLLKRIGFTKIKISSWTFSDNMYCDAWK
ncbi:MAG: methyltransferase domain-containing protein [Candidatus Omnitrophota bacterium]